MHSSILLTAFHNTSAEMLIEDGPAYSTMILPNDKVKDSEMLIAALQNESFAYVICIGQRPNIRNKVHIETTGRCGDVSVDTGFDCEHLAKAFQRNGVETKLSRNAGRSFCNQLYYNVLRYLSENIQDTQIVFIHIPYRKNIDDFNGFCQCFWRAIKEGV